jgi:hypothetical protein
MKNGHPQQDESALVTVSEPVILAEPRPVENDPNGICEKKLWLQESNLEVNFDTGNLKAAETSNLGGHLRWLGDCIKIPGCRICESHAGRCNSVSISSWAIDGIS